MSIYGIACDIAYGVTTRAVVGLTSVMFLPTTEEEEKLYLDLVQNDIESVAQNTSCFLEEKEWSSSPSIQKQIHQIYNLCKQLLSDINYVYTQRSYNNQLLLFKGWRRKPVRSVLERIMCEYQQLKTKMNMLEQMMTIQQALPDRHIDT